jgi:hypothetical protein
VAICGGQRYLLPIPTLLSWALAVIGEIWS